MRYGGVSHTELAQDMIEQRDIFMSEMKLVAGLLHYRTRSWCNFNNLNPCTTSFNNE
jgi:hypothetical protein